MAGEKLSGTYKLKSSEKFEEYMKAIGVGMATRKLGNLAKPTLIIKIDDKSINIKSHSSFKNIETQCTLDEEFDEESADGRKCKSIMKWEGDKLVQTQTWDGKTTTLSRYREGDNLIIDCVYKDVICKRVYVPSKA